MKNKDKQLDVDFIGGQGPLTKEEETQISDFIKIQKKLRVPQENSVAHTSKKSNVSV